MVPYRAEQRVVLSHDFGASGTTTVDLNLKKDTVVSLRTASGLPLAA
jgi:hypothetical protein